MILSGRLLDGTAYTPVFSLG